MNKKIRANREKISELAKKLNKQQKADAVEH